MSDQVAKTDSGNVAAMVDAIEADLRDEQYRVTIIAARDDEAPPPVRLEVQVLSSASGDSSVRGAGHLAGFFGVAGLAGSTVGTAGSVATASESGRMLIDAYVVRGRGRPLVYLGRIDSSSLFAVSEEAIAAGERAGHFVTSRALHGPPPPEPSNLR